MSSRQPLRIVPPTWSPKTRPAPSKSSQIRRASLNSLPTAASPRLRSVTSSRSPSSSRKAGNSRQSGGTSACCGSTGVPPSTSTTRNASSASKLQTSKATRSASGMERDFATPLPLAVTSTVQVPGRTCTRRIPSASNRAGSLLLSASGTKSSGRICANVSSRTRPETWICRRVTKRAGTLSRASLNIWTWTVSCASSCCSHRPRNSPSPSRSGRSIRSPLTTRSISARRCGMGKTPGLSSHAKCPVSRWLPGPNRTVGAPLRSTTAMLWPSSRTSTGQYAAFPGSTSHCSAANTCHRRVKLPPLSSTVSSSLPGQAQTKSASVAAAAARSNRNGQSRYSLPASTQGCHSRRLSGT